MTNELEKQFFNTFRIEPKKGCTAYDKFTEEEADVICNDKCAECSYLDDIYPQITDRILLELICILGNTSYFLITDDGLPIDVDGLKKSVLHSLTLQAKVYKNKVLKHQVRTLFEEK